ncbi:YrhK family protein [Methylophaga sulfidovorans]|uniref:YrhK-like protein n=1 Tax=Methylophaga sulfidovorans TaxID=45496 RepID=A0A1I4B5K9_9GAMM|nr:YrhK family protein [Methylophaga sulfidovorans]SFK64044.1 YrhK-like protein [Methylophaga sulfidovorans]
MSESTKLDSPITFTIGHEQLQIRRRYEVASIFNDFLIALWFLAGSILFLFPSYETAAIWFFIIGSFQFLLRPSIRLASHIHLQRIPESEWEK